MEIGHTSTDTPIFLDSSLATGWRTRAKPWPIREVLNSRASSMFWSTSVPSASADKHGRKGCLIGTYTAGCVTGRRAERETPFTLGCVLCGRGCRLTGLSGVEEEGEVDASLSRERQSLSEEPERPSAVLSAHLEAQEQRKLNLRTTHPLDLHQTSRCMCQRYLM